MKGSAMLRFMCKMMLVAAFLTVWSAPATAAPKIPVFVSIVPQKYFVQQIGRDLVAVQAMVLPGASPATYEPKPRQMAALAKAEIYFAIGVPFETIWLDKLAAANPGMRIVHTDRGILKLPMQTHRHPEEAAHRHDPNSPGTPDPHVWLSPPLVLHQARAILIALQAADPAHYDVYETNYAAFTARILQLDAALRKSLAPRQGQPFMVFHPAWGYFARAYGLEQVPVEIEGKAPKPAQLHQLIERARQQKIGVVFVQPQFSVRSSRQIAREIDGRVAVADPLAFNWSQNLRDVADRIVH